MAVRRSARLRGRSESAEAEYPSIPADTMAKLSSVPEREDTPPESMPTLEPKTETPRNSTAQKTAVSSSKKQLSPAKTPTSAAIVRPPLEEMHPSKVHLSTTKQPDTGLVLGFQPVRRDANGNIVRDTAIQSTPSKIHGVPSSPCGTPAFEFKFSCQDAQLSEEAKRLMDSVREDVARIKAQMIMNKDKQSQVENAAENVRGRRKIAQPKGKAGRFSDVHMAEFKKMDSIAGHPSAFRATPGRFQPVGKSLKRTNSKARLDEPEPSAPPSKVAPQVPAKPTVSVSKRVKVGETDDASTSRPEADGQTAAKPSIPGPKAFIRSSLTTPTRSFAARAASVRPVKTSHIPSLARSPDTKTSIAPRTPQTEFNPRLKSRLPTLGNLKSILRRRQPLFSRDPAKIAAGTHVAAPDFSRNLLVSGTGNPIDGELRKIPSPKKHVEFTPSVKSRHELAEPLPSPSPIKTLDPAQFGLSSDVIYPVLPTLTPERDSVVAKSPSAKLQTPTIRKVCDSEVLVRPIASLSTLPAVPHGIQNKKRHREETDEEADIENAPPEPRSVSEEPNSKRRKTIAPTSVKKSAAASPMKSRIAATPSRGPVGRTATPASARQKGVLSLSRLQQLAKPKERR